MPVYAATSARRRQAQLWRIDCIIELSSASSSALPAHVNVTCLHRSTEKHHLTLLTTLEEPSHEGTAAASQARHALLAWHAAAEATIALWEGFASCGHHQHSVLCAL